MKPMTFRLVALFTALLSLSISAQAAPSVSGASGTFATGQTIRLSGSGFGSKSPAAPQVWADFESGANPSSLGLSSSWGGVQALTWSPEGFGGSKGMKASNGSGAWSLMSSYSSWTRENQHVYIYKKQKVNFLVTSQTQNWKIWRMWPTSSGNYPNIYIAAHNGRCFVENIGTESGFYGNFVNTSTNWNTEEIIFKASSAINLKDGLVSYRLNGVQKTSGSVLTRSSAAPAYMNANYVVHQVLANSGQWSPGWSSNNRMWVDDVYVDTTWSRVMIGDAATFSSCRTLDIQIPTAWADGSVTTVANTKSFSTGARAYVYVFDKDNNVNGTGYPITIGQGGTTVSNGAPSVNIGVDRSLTLGQTLNLSPTVSDDGLPTPARLTYAWSQVLGPTAATIPAIGSLIPGLLAFPAVGQYVLRLTVSDGSLSSADDVSINVQAVNGAPTVNAGPAANVTAGAVLTVTGVVSDDGLPSPPGRTTVTWASISGPSTPAISEPAALSTDIRFLTAGTYVLRLTATDGALSTSATKTVTVSAATGNVAPLANAGNDITITLPSRASLAGSATDDGLPANSQITHAWLKVSGPGTVGFGDINSAITWAEFSQEGTYILRLASSDGSLTASDDVQVTVNPIVVTGGGNTTPTIGTVTGRLLPGGALTITGANFGEKNPAAPYLWSDFEAGIQASSLGVRRAFDETENVVWSTEGFGGSRGVKAADGNGVWTMRVDFRDWTRDGQKAYIYKKQRLNFLVTSDSQNFKTWRMWPSSLGYPNLYAAANNGRIFVENIGVESGFWSDFKSRSTNWATEETQFQASSAINKKDGLLVLRTDGVEKARGSILTRSSTSPSPMVLNYAVHAVAANKSSWSPDWNTNNRLWVDDVYVDTTWSRVMIGEAPVYTSCRNLEIQIPTGWSDNQITVAARSGRYAKGNRVYLYVFDKDGNVNHNGFPMVIDSSGVGSLVDGGATDESSLDAAIQNVFNPARGENASLAYVLKAKGSVKVIIFDRVGHRIKELTGDERLEGAHTIAWDGRNEEGSTVASGIYIAVAKGTDGSRSRSKIAVIK